MNTLEQPDLSPIVAQLLRRQRQLEKLLGASTTVLIVVSAITLYALHSVAHPQRLTLRRLDIVDENGVARVILAAPAPPPTRFGKHAKRDGPVSGVILIDSTGTERGGYVTSDGSEGNALLTLDAQGRQTVLLLAEPLGSTLFRLWDQSNGSLVMGSGTTGPFLNIHKGNILTFSTPKGNEQSTSSNSLLR